jgi:peptide/nickel transport system permease protein
MVKELPASELEVKPRSSFWQSRPVRRFRRNPLAVTGLIIVLLFVLAAIFAPLLAPPKGNCLRDLNVPENSSVYNPVGALFWKAIFAAPPSCYQITRINFSPIPTPPGQQALLGTSNGYDIWYGLVWGTRTMFILGLIVVALNLVIGIVLGAASGYFGGWFDNLVQRFIDVIFAFPGLILTVVLVTIFRPSLPTIILAFTIAGWAGYARVVRGEVLKVRALEFVDGARALGASDWRIIFRHVLPNSLTAIMVIAVLDLGTIPLGAAALSFLGIGLPVGYADWGQLISFARAWIQGPVGNPFGYWYVSFFPAFTIILFSLGWNLLGDAVRDAIDPRET